MLHTPLTPPLSFIYLLSLLYTLDDSGIPRNWKMNITVLSNVVCLEVAILCVSYAWHGRFCNRKKILCERYIDTEKHARAHTHRETINKNQEGAQPRTKKSGFGMAFYRMKPSTNIKVYPRNKKGTLAIMCDQSSLDLEILHELSSSQTRTDWKNISISTIIPIINLNSIPKKCTKSKCHLTIKRWTTSWKCIMFEGT